MRFLLSHDPDTIGAERIQSIIDAKYTKTDLTQVVQTCSDLMASEQIELLKLLQKFEDLFDGTLGSQEQKLRDEVSRLEKYGVLRKINRSEWANPMFTIPKPDGSLRSLADLKRIKRKPYPLPKISDLMQKLEGFTWATEKRG